MLGHTSVPGTNATCQCVPRMSDDWCKADLMQRTDNCRCCRQFRIALSGIYPGGIRSNFCNEESIVSHAWPRMVYVTTCGLNWPGSSRLVALTAISSGIATNVR